MTLMISVLYTLFLALHFGIELSLENITLSLFFVTCTCDALQYWGLADVLTDKYGFL